MNNADEPIDPHDADAAADPLASASAPGDEEHPDLGPGDEAPPLSVSDEVDARRRRGDRWAHRRGEPRVFTLLWSIYLLIAAILTVFGVRFIGMSDTGMFRPSMQSMFMLTAVGIGVLWPMARLSQASPRKPRTAGLADILAIAIPAQAVVWPSKLLTSWSWEVTGGVALMLATWSILIGALVATGTVRAPGLGRTLWMLACLALVAGAPAVMMLASLVFSVSPPEAGWLASPITAPFALTDAPSGLSPAMERQDWAAAIFPGLIGGVWWVWLGSTALLRTGGR